jgi:co-chaperonin GroES (HSP10)
MNAHPTGKNILIERHANEVATEKGFLIGGTSIERSQSGTVLSVGPACATAKIGYTALFSENGGRNVYYKEKSYFVIREDEVVMFLDESETTHQK